MQKRVAKKQVSLDEAAAEAAAAIAAIDLTKNEKVSCTLQTESSCDVSSFQHALDQQLVPLVPAHCMPSIKC